MPEFHIEHHPENGDAKHVVIMTEPGTDTRLWFACRTREDAEHRGPELLRQFVAHRSAQS